VIGHIDILLSSDWSRWYALICDWSLSCQVSETKSAVDALEKEVGFCLRGYVDGTSLVPRHLQIDVGSLAEYLTDTLGLTSEGTYT